jgi:lysozyme
MFRKLKVASVAAVVLAGAFYFTYPYLEIARLWFGVVGVDVSHYQGAIDWQKLSHSDIRFAYIKATEGGDYVDPTFQDNWKRAKAVGLPVGGYHFFTRCKSGQEQAKNFLATLPLDPDALPPVIDVEKMEPCPSGTANADPTVEISVMLGEIQKSLGCRPIIYATPEFDLTYLSGKYISESFWVRSIMLPPLLRRDSWVFWQFHNSGVRPGIQQPVDLNVFRGTAADFTAFRAARACGRAIVN